MKNGMKELVLRIKAGDEGAVSRLYEVCRAPGIATAQKYSKDIYEAEDLFHDAFMKVLENLDKFDETREFMPWFQVVVINTCKNHLRKKSPSLFSEMDSEEGEFVDTLESQDPLQDAADRMEFKELKKIIGSMILKLPKAQQEAIVLHYYQERSVEEIARIQGCPADTVKSRLNYGRKKLAEAIESYQKKTDTRLYGISGFAALYVFFHTSLGDAMAKEALAAGGLAETGGSGSGAAGGAAEAKDAAAAARKAIAQGINTRHGSVLQLGKWAVSAKMAVAGAAVLTAGAVTAGAALGGEKTEPADQNRTAVEQSEESLSEEELLKTEEELEAEQAEQWAILEEMYNQEQEKAENKASEASASGEEPGDGKNRPEAGEYLKGGEIYYLDLDGDGTEEKFVYEAAGEWDEDQEVYSRVDVWINDEPQLLESYDNYPDDPEEGRIYLLDSCSFTVIDLDEADGKVEFLIGESVENGESITYFARWENGAFYKIGSATSTFKWGSGASWDGSGHVKLKLKNSIYNTITYLYRYDGKELIPQEKAEFTPQTVTFMGSDSNMFWKKNTEDWVLTAYKDRDESSGTITWKQGTVLTELSCTAPMAFYRLSLDEVFLDDDAKNGITWHQFEDESGNVGWVKEDAESFGGISFRDASPAKLFGIFEAG